MNADRPLLAALAAVLLACASSEAPIQAAAPPPAPPAAVPEPPSAPVTVPPTPAPTGEAPNAGAATAKPAVREPDVWYVPTPQVVVDRMLAAAKVKKTDVVYDLGCGDGRIVVTAAKKYGARAFGYDIDPKRVEEAKENVKKAGVE